ncbi:MAG TPA: D-glycero-beta-D-manno-heptose 1-phosphate adenylyltransferase [Fibrobacteria bacterium]|nr:D-glycero-beta-D-manno-heptose 1-phosphate adenylyltransferase [Fibrobacteria bacterium]
MSLEHPSKVLEALGRGFGHPRILVLGDLMLDRHIFGEVHRISPEAPVPVLRYSSQTEAAGGAGNVARNLARLGCQVELGAVLGTDSDSGIVLGELAREGVGAECVLRVADRPTIVKTRLIGGHQQMLRIDTEVGSPLGLADAGVLERTVLDSIGTGGFSAVLLSDYDKGVLSPAFCRSVIAACRRLGIPVLVDPKGSDMDKYRGATCLTPNRGEFAVLARAAGADGLPLPLAARKVLEWLELEHIVVTLSEEGMTLVTRTSHLDVPASAREVFDVTGAGDTVIAVLAAGLCGGMDLAEAARLSNLAGGLVVGRLGTAPVEVSDLEKALSGERPSFRDKICPSWAAARELVESWKAGGETVVFTNGCFDILHAGHATYLERARSEGTRLLLGLNTDESTRRLKGPSRPVNSQEDRAIVLAALSSVDAVVLFGEETPLELIRALRPDILAKGADYRPDQVVGADDVRSWGGRLVLVPLLDGRSTTATLVRLGGDPSACP